ncbi:hypothetical protein CBR_g11044 [Chara braunii]|uniref:Uncharacterized protein n=1 Tax=Chara braunii TaxID=69332 RepID=A0A388KPX5_CHABU|nr:hypothetical protein CBR_g11044 [Chara braunii]|eukprot:GBG72111.1 hypothetical protein CBR_g11044 [Chara braunii]
MSGVDFSLTRFAVDHVGMSGADFCLHVGMSGVDFCLHVGMSGVDFCLHVGMSGVDFCLHVAMSGVDLCLHVGMGGVDSFPLRVAELGKLFVAGVELGNKFHVECMLVRHVHDSLDRDTIIRPIMADAAELTRVFSLAGCFLIDYFYGASASVTDHLIVTHEAWDSNLLAPSPAAVGKVGFPRSTKGKKRRVISRNDPAVSTTSPEAIGGTEYVARENGYAPARGYFPAIISVIPSVGDEDLVLVVGVRFRLLTARDPDLMESSAGVLEASVGRETPHRRPRRTTRKEIIMQQKGTGNLRRAARNEPGKVGAELLRQIQRPQPGRWIQHRVEYTNADTDTEVDKDADNDTDLDTDMDARIEKSDGVALLYPCIHIHLQVRVLVTAFLSPSVSLSAFLYSRGCWIHRPG